MFQKEPLEKILQSQGRVYHDLRHIHDLVDFIAKAPISEFDKDILIAVAWFHDIFYDVNLGSPQNEEKSIEFFRNYPHSFNTQNALRIENIIRATSMHLASDAYDDHLINLFLDFDMHSFAQSYEKFSEYSRRVQDEYVASGHSPFDVKEGQRQFLKKLMEKDKIYRSKECSSWEDVARANIKRKLQDMTPVTAKTLTP